MENQSALGMKFDLSLHQESLKLPDKWHPYQQYILNNSYSIQDSAHTETVDVSINVSTGTVAERSANAKKITFYNWTGRAA